MVRLLKEQCNYHKNSLNLPLIYLRSSGSIESSVFGENYYGPFYFVSMFVYQMGHHLQARAEIKTVCVIIYVYEMCCIFTVLFATFDCQHYKKGTTGIKV